MISFICNFHLWFFLSRDCIDPLKWPAQFSVAPTCFPTNIIHILHFIMWIEVNVQDMNFLKGGGWFYTQLTNETTGNYLFIRLWTHHGQLVWNRVSGNPGLTLINTYRLSWYSSWVIFLTIISEFAHSFPTVCDWLTSFCQIKLTFSSSTDNETLNLHPISFFHTHSKPQCMLKSWTQSVYLLCQSSSLEGVYSFLFCIQPFYPQGYQKRLFLERKVIIIIIHLINSGDEYFGITPLCHSQTMYQQCPICT